MLHLERVDRDHLVEIGRHSNRTELTEKEEVELYGRRELTNEQELWEKGKRRKLP